MALLSWSDLSTSDKNELVRRYDTDRSTIDYSQYNASPDSLHRMIRRYRRSVTKSPASYVPFDTALNDLHRWQQTLAALQNKHRHLTVMHLCDAHVPHHNPDALNLAYKLAQHTQPHIAVVGSDFADFSLLSSFGVDPDTTEDADELDLFEQHWLPHIHALDSAGVGAMVWIAGNHEKRIIKYLQDKAPSLRKTIMRRFVEIIRAGGRVQYIGEVDRVQIGNTLISHGNRFGIYPARGLLDDVGYQMSVMAGHNHRTSYFEKRGALYTVKGVVSGCLCDTEPHYIRAGALRGKWIQGTCIADIDTRGHANMFYNLEFNETDNGMETRLGFTTIS